MSYYEHLSRDKRLKKVMDRVGPLELKVQERKEVNIPLLVSAAAIVAGLLLVVMKRE